MLLVHYRSVAQGANLPIDQRWRTFELDPVVFPDLDLDTPAGIGEAVRRISNGEIANVEPIPTGNSAYLTNTSVGDHWDLALTITKVTA